MSTSRKTRRRNQSAARSARRDVEQRAARYAAESSHRGVRLTEAFTAANAMLAADFPDLAAAGELLVWAEDDELLIDWLRGKQSNPEGLEGAPSTNQHVAIDSRLRNGMRQCLLCGSPAGVAYIGATAAGPRWFDFCVPHGIAVRNLANDWMPVADV